MFRSVCVRQMKRKACHMMVNTVAFARTLEAKYLFGLIFIASLIWINIKVTGVINNLQMAHFELPEIPDNNYPEFNTCFMSFVQWSFETHHLTKDCVVMFDESRLYKIHLSFASGVDWSGLSMRGICVATQTTLDEVHWIVNLTSHWTGPVSLSVFAPDMDFFISIHYISYLRSCFPQIKELVSFHIVYPVDRPPQLFSYSKEIKDFMTVNNSSCTDYKPFLQKLIKNYRPFDFMDSVPRNIMWNVAKNSCQNEFLLCLEINMIPTAGLMEDLEEFLWRPGKYSKHKVAYVIPVYELLKMNSPLPSTKKDLVALVKRGLAIEHHVKLFRSNSVISNFRSWEKQKETPSLRVAFALRQYSFLYEPVFVTRGNVPNFQERFLGANLTRNLQVYEMILQNYTFHVLNNAFIVGFEFPRRNLTQEELMLNNDKNFKTYLRETATKYDKDPFGLVKRFKARGNLTILVPG